MNRRVSLVLVLFITIVVSLSVVVSAGAQDTAGNMIDLDHPYAAFLESRAYGASLGATAEFRKMEWVLLDEVNMRWYITMSDVNESMSDGEGDISVDETRCGIVYTGDMAEDYTISEMRPLVVGGPYNPDESNRCDVSNISNPDGLALDARGRLWIAEDTGNHKNNMLWVYDPADGSLKRFGYVPRGAEITGAYITADGTLFFSNQHPNATDIYPYNAGTVLAVNGFNANTDDFEPIAVPEGDAQLVAAVAAGELQLIARSGDPIPASINNNVFGGIYRVDGSLQYVNNDPDGLMWLPVSSDSSQGWLYINYEGIPGGVGRAYLQKTETGWNVLDGQMVDFSSVNGTWTNCGSSVTPWNTGLTSEEYEPIASDFNTVAGMSDYLGSDANPYDYGWMVELAPDGVGDEVSKRYAMGRFSHENAWVAGDERTVYFGDDGSNVMLFRFIAAEAGDLSSGTLYAAHITQTGGTGAAEHAFQLEWIELGTAADADIEAAVRELDR